ncbi:BamA/TamA family outer membrane protein [Gramella sp. MAR_2010_147]|uniref:translocation and assembly module lipoprotein TamL n=1 Tax=Gramella sp. MAR_2010_147 TaxID=1250205 RepID=UPI00087DA036|nr:BamA/TamA family outer membrane protein [Gramella sp. MAR_2010_147]SDR79937.1 Outer membrane protein assembly factor BamA [Gramella sp. MAR_2010_147]
MKIKDLSILFILIALFQACSVEKFIPDDEFLYTGAEIKIDSDTTITDRPQLRTELENVLRPEPNTQVLGMRPGLYFHYKSQREKPGFINKFLNKKFGEAPVYLSDVDLKNTEDLLLNRLENRGFFYSRVSSDAETNENSKTASTSYTLTVPDPYTMETYQLDSDTLLVYQDIKKDIDKTLMKEEMRFDLPKLKLERERIDINLKKKGYYNFNPGFLIFEADTNQYDQKKFDLFLRLKKDVPSKSVIPYQISNVNVYPNYNIDEDSVTKNYKRYKDKNYFQEELLFKPEYLDPYILIETGDTYDPEVSRNTSRRLGTIGSYKFVNIRYDEIDTLATDSIGLLEANIFLSPLKKRAIRAELQAVTKSNSFAGPHLALSFLNRNLFKGGESLKISANLGYEFQMDSGGSLPGSSSLQLGLTNDLIIPRLLFPVKFSKDFFKYDIPKTKISLGGDYLRRSQLFTLASLNASFGYLWNANRYVSHEFNPISLNYVSLTDVTTEFGKILKANPFLESSFDQEFIAGLTYSFIYNGLIDGNKTNAFFLNANVDIAGNSMSLLGKEAEDGKKEVFGLEYAQYAKLDLDLRYHLRLGNQQVIATRLFAGYGRPYGNSEVMPFSKQYFSGGPYSVRAFRTRSLGPGTFNPAEPDQIPDNPEEEISNTGFRDQTGNIRFEANAEYRFPIITYLNGAFFVDAGNVWTSNAKPETTNLNGDGSGKFESDFLNELGIGAGAGLRIDIQSFVIRFDLAFPMHDPRKPIGDRWVNDFGNPVFNFAIGYPF